MAQSGERQQLSPVVFWVIIGVVVVAAVAIGFKVLGGAGSGEFQKGGSEELMNKVQSGGKLYEPPAAALPMDAKMRSGPGAGGGMYNLTPPTGGANGPPTGMPGGVPTGPPGGAPMGR